MNSVAPVRASVTASIVGGLTAAPVFAGIAFATTWLTAALTLHHFRRQGLPPA